MLPFVIAATTIFGMGIAQSILKFIKGAIDDRGDIILYSIKEFMICLGMLLFGACTIFYWR